MADVVLRAVRAGRWQGPGGYPTVLAVEPGCGETERVGGPGPSREKGHFLDRGTPGARRTLINDHDTDPVPPRGTLDRILLRTVQTGLAVVYYRLRNRFYNRPCCRNLFAY